MSRLLAILIACAPTIALAGPPRVALVRVTDVYQKLPGTKAEQEAIAAEHSAILHDRRADELRKLIESLKALQEQLKGTQNASQEERLKLSREFDIKRNEVQSVQQEFETFRTQRTLEINRKMVAGMRAALKKISETTDKIAREQGFDWVIDSSGNSNTGVPALLYSKEPHDLTDAVIVALGGNPKAEPAKPEANTPPSP